MSVEFSIIIPAHNAGSTITKLLDSVSNQTYRDFEVIVVDDNSSDNTRDLVSKYPVRALNLDKNRGSAYARNFGAKNARADILVFFDSDVVLGNDVMQKFHENFKNYNMDVLLGMYSDKPANEGFLREWKALQEQVWYSEVPPDNAIPFTPYAGAIKKRLFFDVGGFDESYTNADVEDYKFTVDLRKKSRIYMDKTIKVEHHFPGFKKLVESYFRRCFLWTEVFLEVKKFDANGTTARQGSLYIFYAAALLSFVLSFFLKFFLPLAVVLLLFGFYSDRKFIMLLIREKGVLFTIPSVILNIFLSVLVSTAAIAGLFYYGVKGRKDAK